MGVATLLLVWEPLNFATEALTVLPTIQYRGWLPGVELAGHALVAALAGAGGMALWNKAPHRTSLGTVAIVASVARTVQSLYWSVLPHATTPGDEPLIAGIAILLGISALFVLHRNRTEGGIGWYKE